MSKSIIAFFSMVLLTIAITEAIFLGADAESASAFDTGAESKVVLIVCDYLDVEDLNKMEYLSSLAGKSHIALMNNRQQGKAGAGKSKLVIGSGKRLEINDNMVSGDSEVRAGELEPGRIIYSDIDKLKQWSNESVYLNYIGYIGDEINKNNGIACFLGNADTSEENRSSMLIAVDSRGVVDIGETEKPIIEDEMFPYGKRTDYKKLAELYKQYLSASSFIVVETGDMERLEASGASITCEAYEAYRNTTIKRIDSFIKELVRHGGFKTLIFVSTFPSKADAEANNRLTPVVVYETGAGGQLYSSSTRREGIVLNTDLADYILSKLGYNKSSAITEVKLDKALHSLEKMNRNIVRVSALRTPVLTYYAVMVMAALVILFTISIFLKKEKNSIYTKLSNISAYIILSFPIAFLYLPAPYLGGSPTEYIVCTTAASVLMSVMLHIALKDKIKVILSICLLLLFGLTTDVLTGSPLIKQSVLGYDPVIGARFYGIGNEYAGMFIGCSLMVIGCTLELRGRRINKTAAILFCAACTAILGLTFLGANFGGALAGAAGYLLAYYLAFGIRFSKRNVCIGVIILGISAAVLIIMDSLGINSPSHIGRLVKDTEADGLGVVISTIQRKISMNLRLIRYTIWTKVLLSIISIITFMFFRPAKLLQKLFRCYKYLRYSWISIAASAITGFGVNDSGIVVAATAMIYTAFTMLIMCIGERNES